MKQTLATLSLMFYAGSGLVATSVATAATTTDMTVQLFMVDAKGVGAGVGQVSVAQSKYGLVFSPALKGLPPGLHGFHLHQNASCEPKETDGKMVPAGAAGDHYDPRKTKTP